MIRTIVVGSDGSAHAQHAVAWAADFAAQLEAEVLLVHVAEPFSPLAAYAGYSQPVPQDIFDEHRAALEKRVTTEFVAPLIGAGVRFQARLLDGEASRVIQEVAGEFAADLIVVGTRGLSSVGEILLGSTSHNLIRHARVPVVVIPVAAPAATSAQPSVVKLPVGA